MFNAQDLMIVGFLVFLEGILSIDNALVLAMLARPLPKTLQRKALTYGLVGAVFFRLISLGLVSYLLKWRWLKYLGGGYLLFISFKHFLSKKPEKSGKDSPSQTLHRSFWKTVLIIELTDIAFAVDSILAAVALSSKFWVVFTGGFLGVVAMRFAAQGFIHLLNRFPNLENAAYWLVMLIGFKVILEGLELPWVDFHSSSSPAFWIFWCLMAIAIFSGLIKKTPRHTHL